jgi:hypothetical protein
MISRLFPALLGGLLLSFGLLAPSVHAQEWAQEVQIITTVGYGEDLHVFVDSLSDALGRNPDVQVKREPQDEATVSFAELREELLRDGVDLNSATHAFIRYRFELETGSEIVETIEELYFIFRGREDRSDLPILYVDTQEPVVNNLIRRSGVPSPVNLKAIRTFRDMLAFPYLNARQETAMVEISGRAVREDNPQEQKLLTDFLTDQMTLGRGSYVLEMPRATVARVASTPDAPQ